MRSRIIKYLSKNNNLGYKKPLGLLGNVEKCETLNLTIAGSFARS